MKREHPECSSCICGKRARVQGNRRIAVGQPGYGPGTIAWAEHEMAWSAYAAQYGRGQGPERMDEHGGPCLEVPGAKHKPADFGPKR